MNVLVYENIHIYVVAVCLVFSINIIKKMMKPLSFHVDLRYFIGVAANIVC